VFPRKKRFPRALLPLAIKTGRRRASEHFTAVFPPNSAGYAIIVSKKVARLSVTRHRIKRRVSAVLRTISLPPALLLFPQSSVSSVSYQDIKKELTNLIS
jgi:ribonuclease P protein component